MARRGGWKRLGRRRFRYVDSRGRSITDEEQLDRIRNLVIPPAWTDVWISPKAGAKLQATGVDAAGRRQYIYHPSFRAAQERAKFERLLRFAESLPALRAHTAQDLRLGPYERDWACAIAVGLVNHGWFRVGSERHARASRTYGITTLTKRHVTVSGTTSSSDSGRRTRSWFAGRWRARRSRAGCARSLTCRTAHVSFASSRTVRSSISPRPCSTSTSASTSGTDSRPRTSEPGDAARCGRARKARSAQGRR
jgi:hypothetical protein